MHIPFILGCFCFIIGFVHAEERRKTEMKNVKNLVTASSESGHRISGYGGFEGDSISDHGYVSRKYSGYNDGIKRNEYRAASYKGYGRCGYGGGGYNGYGCYGGDGYNVNDCYGVRRSSKPWKYYRDIYDGLGSRFNSYGPYAGGRRYNDGYRSNGYSGFGGTYNGHSSYGNIGYVGFGSGYGYKGSRLGDYSLYKNGKYGGLGGGYRDSRYSVYDDCGNIIYSGLGGGYRYVNGRHNDYRSRRNNRHDSYRNRGFYGYDTEYLDRGYRNGFVDWGYGGVRYGCW
ncbi:uncharacterized protein LOC143238942 [Tachypleus tridentatus]|uniref:uncharacterized protein LOC143238942 n=1 Tax=Tachypleus tridentatus TaxID=6853 RepID=UPI003FD504DE